MIPVQRYRKPYLKRNLPINTSVTHFGVQIKTDLDEIGKRDFEKMSDLSGFTRHSNFSKEIPTLKSTKL